MIAVEFNVVYLGTGNLRDFDVYGKFEETYMYVYHEFKCYKCED